MSRRSTAAPRNPKARFVTVPQLVELTGLHENTIRNHIKSGVIPSTMVGNRRLIPTSYLDNLEKRANARAL
ncbi:helix-turn-helix domain-containing protein [Gordonia sp. NPDC003950]